MQGLQETLSNIVLVGMVCLTIGVPILSCLVDRREAKTRSENPASED